MESDRWENLPVLIVAVYTEKASWDPDKAQNGVVACATGKPPIEERFLLPGSICGGIKEGGGLIAMRRDLVDSCCHSERGRLGTYYYLESRFTGLCFHKTIIASAVCPEALQSWKIKHTFKTQALSINVKFLCI